MSSGFANQVDYFDIADINWELQSSTLSPESSQAQVADENGDIACEKVFESTESVECVYVCVGSGDGNAEIDLPANFQAGTVSTVGGVEYVITGGTLDTSNTARPSLTVTGTKFFGDERDMKIYDFGTAVGKIKARKVPTYVGYQAAAGTVLQSCSVSFTTEAATVTGDDGEFALIDLYAGRAEATQELSACLDGASVGAAAAGWTALRGDEYAKENTNYQTISRAAFKNIDGADWES